MRRLAAGDHRVAMLARDGERLARFAAEIDARTRTRATSAIRRSSTRRSRRSAASSAHRRCWCTTRSAARSARSSTSSPRCWHNFDVNVMALRSRALAPDMVAPGRARSSTGNIGVARQGVVRGFADQGGGILAGRSRARSEGVYVAYVVIDAVIDLEWTRRMFAGKPDDFFIKPSAFADEIWHDAARTARRGRSTSRSVRTERRGDDRPASRRFAAEWIEAWNAHDLERILAHYADDFEMASPSSCRSRASRRACCAARPTSPRTDEGARAAA